MILIQNLKYTPKNPEWFKAFRKLSDVQCDPGLKQTMKNAVLELIRQSIHNNAMLSHLEGLACLKKYTSSSKPDKPQEKYFVNDSSGIERFARELEHFIGETGNQPDAVRFLRSLRGIFWNHRTGTVLERYMVLYYCGSKQQKIRACWDVMVNVEQRAFGLSSRFEIDPAPEQESFLSLFCTTRMRCVAKKRPGWEYMRWACPIFNFKSIIKNSHSYIKKNELNVFALNVLGTKRPLSKADFFEIVYNGRPDFLEFLLSGDLPEGKLPLSNDELLVFFAANPQLALGNYRTNPQFSDEIQLKALQLLEKRSPGCIRKFEDAFGRNLLWYSFFTTEDYPFAKDGIVQLTPGQRLLYDLCDHGKPDCDGLSFDDLISAFGKISL